MGNYPPIFWKIKGVGNPLTFFFGFPVCSWPTQIESAFHTTDLDYISTALVSTEMSSLGHKIEWFETAFIFSTDTKVATK